MLMQRNNKDLRCKLIVMYMDISDGTLETADMFVFRRPKGDRCVCDPSYVTMHARLTRVCMVIKQALSDSHQEAVICIFPIISSRVMPRATDTFIQGHGVAGCRIMQLIPVV